MKDKAQIHCPHCEWRPAPETRWVCVPSCATTFHTFWTRALCPGCGVKWPKTACHACGRWSPHEAWYHEPPEDERQEDEARELVHEDGGPGPGAAR